MKKLVILLCFQVSLLGYIDAQVFPKGMNYQAVARQLNGAVIDNEKIGLKVVLYSSKEGKSVIHYSELHPATTNALGLFNLIVGEGIKEAGEYGLVPWNTDNIWMEVSVKENHRINYTILSNSKLLAVPYAIHAATADKLAPKNENSNLGTLPPEPGVISTEWSVLGNAKTDASGNIFRTNSLGTTDFIDLIMITDNVERLRIRAGGDIFTKLNFEIGKNLNIVQDLYVLQSATFGDTLIVKKNVLLNTMGGSTFNYGPFTVANLSPTVLTGTLTVDKVADFNTTLNVDKSTNLNRRLYVNKGSPTRFTGTLVVDSTTNLNDALNVNNISPTLLTGTLMVDSAATFNHKIKILSQYSTDTSGLFPSGSLQVGGGAYIKENLYVGGIAKFGGPVAFAGAVTITDGTQSTDPLTGALKVAGGVGIGLNLNVGGGAMFGGMTTVQDLSQSFTDSTGALKVYGGVGILKRLNVGGDAWFGSTLRVGGASYLSNLLYVTSSESFIVNFRNTSNRHGISIQVANGAPGWANNYLEFRGAFGNVVGRVEGENATEYTNNLKYKIDLEVYETAIAYAGVIVAQQSINVAMAIAGVIAAATSTTICAGFGICFTVPIISLNIVAGLTLAAYIGALVAAGVGVVLAVKSRDDFVDYRAGRVGVTYESGAGDYAEWLPKIDPDETFLPGHVVGLKNGKITKITDGASNLMVISTKPIVLGNTPEKGMEVQFEKVAFMGQVPVHVLGKVNIGDYIVPDGHNMGLGKAISPAKMEVEDYTRIVGVAWSASENDAYNMINVAVGLNTGDISKVVHEQEKLIRELESEFNESTTALSKVVPGFKKAAETLVIQNSAKPKQNSDFKDISASDLRLLESYKGTYNFLEISEAQVSEMLNSTEKTMVDQGVKTEDHPFWRQIKNEPGYREQLIKDIQSRYKFEVQNYIARIKARP